MGRMDLSQEIAVAVATMIGALLSLFGSSCIIWNILRKQKYKQDTYHRLLFAICAFDVLGAIGWFMAPLAPPKDSSPRALSIGNTASCTSQAFFLQAGIAFMIYNACLSIFYLLTIGHNVPQRRMIWRETIMHVVSLIWGLGAAIIPIPLEIYNEIGVGSGCWIQRYPVACETEENPVPCSRGANIDHTMVGNILAGVPAVVSLLTVIVCNFLIYRAVRQRELASNRFSIGHRRIERMQERTRAIAAQARWYVIIFVNAHIWEMIFALLEQIHVITKENESSFTALILLSQFFAASNGFGFLFVYVRPRYLRLRKRNVAPLLAVYTALSFRDAPRTVKSASRTSSFERDAESKSSDDSGDY